MIGADVSPGVEITGLGVEGRAEAPGVEQRVSVCRLLERALERIRGGRAQPERSSGAEAAGDEDVALAKPRRHDRSGAEPLEVHAGQSPGAGVPLEVAVVCEDERRPAMRLAGAEGQQPWLKPLALAESSVPPSPWTNASTSSAATPRACLPTTSACLTRRVQAVENSPDRPNGSELGRRSARHAASGSAFSASAIELAERPCTQVRLKSWAGPIKTV